MSRKRTLIAAKRRFQIGDVVHNPVTRESGKIVRAYSDLIPPEENTEIMAYIVALPDGEVLWRDDDIDASEPEPQAGSFPESG